MGIDHLEANFKLYGLAEWHEPRKMMKPDFYSHHKIKDIPLSCVMFVQEKETPVTVHETVI